MLHVGGFVLKLCVCVHVVQVKPVEKAKRSFDIVCLNSPAPSDPVSDNNICLNSKGIC